MAPDATVQANVRRLDQDASRAVRLIPQFSVVRRTSVTRAATVGVPTRGQATADLVAAMGQLADGVAAPLVIG